MNTYSGFLDLEDSLAAAAGFDFDALDDAT